MIARSLSQCCCVTVTVPCTCWPRTAARTSVTHCGSTCHLWPAWPCALPTCPPRHPTRKTRRPSSPSQYRWDSLAKPRFWPPFLQAQPWLVMPLEGHSWLPRICPLSLMLSAPSVWRVWVLRLWQRHCVEAGTNILDTSPWVKKLFHIHSIFDLILSC